MTYPHTTFSTNCGVPSISLSQEQKDLVSKVMNEGAFKNPIEGEISNSSNLVDSISSSLESYSGDLDVSSIISSIDALKGSDGLLEGFQKHTNRLSGVDLSNDGSLFGFQGLQGIASSYNTIQETMKTGEAIEDNYSQMFSSVLDSGQNMMGDISSKLSAISNIDIEDITTQEELENLIPVADIDSIASNLTDSISADNLHLSTALNAVKKFGLGMMVVGMGKDSCFGNTLLDNIATDSIKDGLNNL